jgi:hypothetical protein
VKRGEYVRRKEISGNDRKIALMPGAECIGFVWPRSKDAGAGSLRCRISSSARVVKLNIRNLIT